MRVKHFAVVVPLMMVVSLSAATREGTLVEALKDGNLDAARALLQKGADVNAPQPDGTTPLHWAAHLNNLEAADLLTRAGANARAANRYGVTPLWLACVNGNAPMIEKLLAAGADPNTTMAEGDTALMTAARSGSAPAVKALLARGANVNAKENWKGQTALMWAASRNNTEVVKALIDAGADVNARTNYKPLALPRPRKTRGGARNLDVTAASGFTAFLFAARAGAIDAARVLMQAGVSPNEKLADGTSALVLAVGSTRYDLAAFLLDNGADPNGAEQGWTALHQLIWTRRPNTGSNNPWPVERDTIDSLSFAKKLLVMGANINAQVTKDADVGTIGRRRYSDIGATPFWLASETLDVPMMRLFVANGADDKRPNVTGTIPLLAASGVGIEMPGENPGSPELVAEAVRFLLDLGSDPTSVDQHGETALHGIALWGSNDALEMLVKAGAKLDAINECGWLPWDIAIGVSYDGNVIGLHPDTAALMRRLMEERGIWKDRPPVASC